MQKFKIHVFVSFKKIIKETDVTVRNLGKTLVLETLEYQMTDLSKGNVNGSSS